MTTPIAEQDRAMLDAICATALDAVVAVDHAGIVIAFNAQAEELFGHSVRNALGRPMAEMIIPERHRAAHTAGMERYQKTAKKKLIGSKVEIEALHADGHEISVELGLSVLQCRHGEVFLSFARDLTERRQRETDTIEARQKAERANASKSFVISMLAHDMRTALGGITGSVALLDRDGMPTRESEVVDAIHSSAHQLRRLLDDTLDFARLDAGEIEVSREPVRIADIIDEVSQTWSPRLRASDISLSLVCDDNAPKMIESDIARLRQVLGNLLANAMKYAGQSDVCLRFSSDGADGVSIVVSDTGCGFSEEALSTAFDPFVRPDGQRAKGAGLGLSIVKTLVERLGGDVVIGASEGGGARIALTLPDCQLAEPAATSEASASQVSFDGLGVLLVEDNATNQLIATRFLEQLGCDVTVCGDGESGVHTAENVGFDAIFMDIDLPKLNGKDAMKLIRSGHGPNSHTPLIAFTAFAIRSQREEIMTAGADTILAKPVSGREDFERVLESVLSLSSVHAEAAAEGQATDSVIDHTRLASLRDTLGDDDFSELTEEFVKDITSLRHALSAPTRDPESIRKTTHIAISVAGAIGARKAQKFAEMLNAAAHSPTLDGLEEGLDNLETALSETMIALWAYKEAS